MKEFRINEFLSVKLDKNTEVFFKDIKVRTCFSAVSNIPRRDADKFENFESIDEYIDSHVSTHGTLKVSDDEIFWATCSSLQFWAENNYATNIISNKDYFYLLEKLANAGDEKAKEIFVKELTRRFDTENEPLRKIIAERFSKYLPSSFFEKMLKVLGFIQIENFNINGFTINRQKIYNFNDDQLIGFGFKDYYLPLSLEGHTQLKFLYIIDVSLRQFPPEIIKMEDLKELILVGGGWYSHFGLKELTEDIGNLKSLEKLIISEHSQLESISQTIGHLERLQFLNLSNNKLNSIPESIGNLTCLKYLNLSNNKLENIPTSIGDLKNIEILDLSQNDLLEIPDSICKLKNLKFLFLSDNPIIKLPKSIKELNCVTLLIGSSLDLISIKEFNKNTHFVKLLTHRLEDPLVRIKSDDITEEFIAEMLVCLRDEKFFDFLFESPELIEDIIITVVKILVEKHSMRNYFTNLIFNNLKEGLVEIGRFFELIFNKENGRLLLNNLITLDSRFYEIIYKILTDHKFSHDFWEYIEFIYQDLAFMSGYVREKIIEMIEKNDFNEFLKFLNCRFFDVLDSEGLDIILSEKAIEFLDFVIKNAILWKNKMDKKYDIFDRDFFGLYLPYDGYNKENLSKAILELIESMNKRQIKTLIELELDYLLDKDDLANLKQEALYNYLKTIYLVSFRRDDGYDWALRKYKRFTRDRPDIKKKISVYIKGEILKAIKHLNFELIQDFLLYYQFYELLVEEDVLYLLKNSDIIGFLIENMGHYDHEGYFINLFEKILPNTISNDLKIILKQKVIESLKRENMVAFETILRGNLMRYLNPEDIETLSDEILVKLMEISDRLRWEYRDYSNELSKEFSEIISKTLKHYIIHILETKDFDEIFKIWDKGYLYELEKEDLIDLFTENGRFLIEHILKSLHYIAYEQKKHRFDSGIGIIPIEHIYPSGYLEKNYIVPKDMVKGYIIEIIKKQDLTSLVPLLASYFLDYLEPSDILNLIADKKSSFFKNVIKILGDHREELHYYNEDFFLEHLKFFEEIKSLNKAEIKELTLSVINDESITNYKSIFEEGLIIKFNYSELIDILENLSSERLKIFFLSLSEAFEYLEGYDEFNFHSTSQYLKGLGASLTDSLRETFIRIFGKSELIVEGAKPKEHLKRIDTGIKKIENALSREQILKDESIEEEDAPTFYDQELRVKTLRLLVQVLEDSGYNVLTNSFLLNMGGLLLEKNDEAFNISFTFSQGTDVSWGYTSEEQGILIEKPKKIILNALEDNDYKILFVGLTPEPFDPKYTPTIKIIFSKEGATKDFELNIVPEGVLFSRDMWFLKNSLTSFEETVREIIDQGKKEALVKREKKIKKRFLELPDLNEDMKHKKVKFNTSKYSEEFISISKYEAKILEYLEDLTGEKLTKTIDVKSGPRSAFELRNNKIVGIRLDWSELKEFPEILLELGDLEKINLSYNKITIIPQSISKLKKLTYLNFTKNLIYSVPESIGDLNELQTLILTENQIRKLPKSISKLRSLQKFALTNNRLEEIPEQLYLLESLIELFLWGNDLKELPKDIGNLALLKNFSFGSYHMTNIPYTIGSLTSLERLYLISNDSIDIPETIEKLQNLEWLDISVHNLSRFPESFGNLNELETLSINSKIGSKLSTQLTRLSSLKMMYLRGEIANVLIHGFKTDRTTDLILYALEQRGVGLYIGEL